MVKLTFGKLLFVSVKNIYDIKNGIEGEDESKKNACCELT